MPQIERICSPALRDFYKDYVSQNRPVILTDAIDSWPAKEKWTPDYLRRHFGDREVVVATLEIDKPSDPRNSIDNLVYRPMGLGKYIDLICQDGYVDGRTYLSQYPIFSAVPELKKDIKPFPYWTNFYHRHRAHKDLIWVGPEGARSHLHYDINHNFVVQLYGSKRWLLFPENQHRFVYLPSGLSRRNISPIDVNMPDLETYPLYKDAEPYEFILRSGEMLFLPGRCAHQVNSLEVSIMMNFWWATIGHSVRNFRRDLSHITLKWLRDPTARYRAAPGKIS